jgi:hypothetical protein
MANNDLKLKPHKLKDQNAWWYEEPGGIVICCDAIDKVDGSKHYKQLQIKWSSLRAAVKRKDK